MIYSNRVLPKLLIPLSNLNYFGGIVGGVWLLFLGEWKLLIIGIITAVTAHWFLGLLFLLEFIFAAPAMFFYRKNIKVLFHIFGTLAVLLRTSIITLWCIGMLVFLFEKYTSTPLLPILLFAYSVINAPISYLAIKDLQGGADEAVFTTLIMEIGLIIVFSILLIADISVKNAMVILGSVLLIGGFFQYIITYLEDVNDKNHKIDPSFYEPDEDPFL